MITKRTLKLIKSLQLKKYRKKYGLFLVEGNKVVSELLRADLKVQTLIGAPVFMETIEDYLKEKEIPEIIIVDEKSLSKAGHLQTNNAALAVVKAPEPAQLPSSTHTRGYILALDNVKDPGNLGTIIRIADWYGIRHIVCSPETTDVYSPKVISASMGSFLRVHIHYTKLDNYLADSGREVYAAYVGEGSNVHHTKFGESGILLMGSESHGISPALEPLVSHKVNIPSFGGAESLNVSVSTGIICDNIRRATRQ